MGKGIHALKAEFVNFRVREKKNSLENTIIDFKAYRKCKSPTQKEF